MRLLPFVGIDDRVEACRRIFVGDTCWTVVRCGNREEGGRQGLPVWSRHMGDPILASGMMRRTDLVLFMVETLNNDPLIHEAPRWSAAARMAADVVQCFLRDPEQRLLAVRRQAGDTGCFPRRL
jgi:hypothetical protein